MPPLACRPKRLRCVFVGLCLPPLIATDTVFVVNGFLLRVQFKIRYLTCLLSLVSAKHQNPTAATCHPHEAASHMRDTPPTRPHRRGQSQPCAKHATTPGQTARPAKGGPAHTPPHVQVMRTHCLLMFAHELRRSCANTVYALSTVRCF